MIVISPPIGDLFACSRGCAATVLSILHPSVGPVPARWTDEDADVFCSGCGVALGSLRVSARLLADALRSPVARALYRKLEDRVSPC